MIGVRPAAKAVNSEISQSINDPIYNFIQKLPVSGVWWLILLICLVVYLAVGLTIDHLYPNAHDLLGIRDPAEILNGINVWVIFVPMAWAYYRWQPAAVLKSFKELEKQGVISSSYKKTDIPITVKLQKNLGSHWVQVLAIIATLISGLYLHFMVIPNQKDTLGGLVDMWYYTPLAETFFLILYVPASYVVFVFALRVLITAITINQFFKSPGVILNLYPLHPDKCGGMGKVGLLVNRTLLIVVLVPIWITIFSLYTVIAGGASQFPLALIVYFVYILIVPIILAFPLWQPHMAMMEYKSRRLFSISKELLDLEKDIARMEKEQDWNGVAEKLENYKRLQEVYNVLDKNIPVWPISAPDLRSFSAIAGSPIVLGFISNVLLEYFKEPLRQMLESLFTHT